MDKKQCGSKGGGNARRSATGGGSGRLHRKGKHHGDGGGGGGGKRREIKVVYISNPMRVTTSEEGFRALVQELTGRHADPSKYRGGGAPVDETSGGGGGGMSSGGSPTGAGEMQGAAPMMLPSPGSTVDSSSTDHGAAGGQDSGQAVPCDDDENSFAPELIDNRYSVCFSPPTFLYGSHCTYDGDDYDL